MENDFWGRKKRILDLSDYKSGFIEAPFLRRRTRASGKFPLILWAIYALFFHHRQIMSPLGA